MTVTESAASKTPAWWSHSASRSGEADPMTPTTPGGEASALGFADFIDVINPLHHIPLVGNLYRAVTGDALSEASRMAGGALWGGPFGLVAALANSITERETGKDMGGTALAWLQDDDPIEAESGPELLAETAAVASAAPAETAAIPGDLPGVLPAAVPAGTPAATSPAATLTASPLAPQPDTRPVQQAFIGSRASQLDAFIRQANAVRTPLETAPAGSTVPTVRSGDTVHARYAAGPQAETPRTPGQGTDVAQWMMRALDKYEMMQARERT